METERLLGYSQSVGMDHLRAAAQLRTKRLAPLIVGLLAASMTFGLTASVEASHLANAAEHNRTPVQVSSSGAEPVLDADERARARAAALREVNDQIEAAQRRLQLATHTGIERTTATEIRAEISRLRNLSKFLWPTEGGVASGFGMRKHPILGYTRLHSGADIGGACGNPIYAAQSGIVTKAGYSSSSGNNIRIDHGAIEGQRVETAYLHMSKLGVGSGQKVSKGDTIGYVGTTGLSTACHLHLALYKNGTSSDPLQYLTRP